MKQILAFLLILAILLGFAACAENNQNTREITEPGWGFPSLIISFETPVERHEWKDATVSLIGTADAFMLEDVEARIRGRGNSSWNMAYWGWGHAHSAHRSKQPFRLRFDQPVSMLDAGYEAQDWTFIANLSDHTQMRNYSAYYLASLLDGMHYAPFARFVHVYFDCPTLSERHIYRGVYMLSVQLSEVLESRVNLREDPDPARSEYLIQMCMRLPWGEDNEAGIDFMTINTRHYEVRFPSGNRLTDDHMDYVEDFLTRIDTAIFAEDDVVFDYIDLDSFIDFFIVQELYKNPDIHFSSVWMQVRGEGADRRLHMGPVWDFDIAAGNAYHQGQHFQGEVALPPGVESYEYGYSPYGHFASVFNQWYRYLMKQPQFFDALLERWNEIRDVQIQQTIDRIAFLAETHHADFQRNVGRWPYMGRYVWPNPDAVVEIDTFMGQVTYLIDFLERRTAWLDVQWNE